MKNIIKQLEYIKSHKDLIEDLDDFIDEVISSVYLSMSKLELQNARMKTILEVLIDKMARG